MTSFIDSMFERAKREIKTIVLPEGSDVRTLEAAQQILKKGFARLVVLGNAETIQNSGYDLEGVKIIDIETFDDKKRYAESFFKLRKEKGISLEEAYAKMEEPLYLGTMMVKLGDADGMVAGACHSTSDTLRAALQILKTAPGIHTVSSFFFMDVPDCEYGENGLFIFCDGGLNIQPSSEMLADEAIASATTWKNFVGTKAYVAMLSHSTLGSAAHSDDSDKVIRAVKITSEIAPELNIDGELQLDAAVVPEVAASKAPDSDVAGKANILIFPDLDAGNIAYKLVERLAKAKAYGPLTQGLAAPVNDLSRGCSVDDIVGVVAITCVQAQG